jgi:hypothetical protein
MNDEKLAELLLALRQWSGHYTMKGAPVALTLNRAAATIRDFAAGRGTVGQPRTNPPSAPGGDLRKEIFNILAYWQESSDPCKCCIPLPMGACLRCDMERLEDRISELLGLCAAHVQK